MTLTLDWVERNGPPARRPRKLGFGSRLVTLVIERQLNGEVHRTFARGGLIVHMVVPLTHERWPSAEEVSDSNSRVGLSVRTPRPVAYWARWQPAALVHS